MASKTNEKSLLLLQTGKGNLMEDAFSADSPDDLSSITKEITEPDKDYSSPLGQINFTVLTDAKDYDIVSITIPKNETVDKLLKSNEKGEYKLFSSELIAFDGDPLKLDEWLGSLTYGVYNYNNDSPSRLFNFSPLVNSNIADLFDSQDQYFDFVGSADGSGYLIDTDSDGNVDLINFLILDEGWFDTRKDELSIIGDPLLPLLTIPSASTSEDGSRSISGSRSTTEPDALPDPGPDLDTVNDRPTDDIDITIPTDIQISEDNSNVIEELGPEISSKSPESVQSPALSSSSTANIQYLKPAPISVLSDSIKTIMDTQARSNTEIQRSRPPRSVNEELSNEQAPLSIDASNETLNTQNDYLDSESNIKDRPDNDFFMSLPKYLPFSNSLETIIAGMFLMPMGLDRLFAFSLGKLKNIPKLLLNKPTRVYNRTWVIPTSTINNEKIILNCNGSALSFATANLFESEQYEVMPGFTSDGISFLWSSLAPNSIGKSLKAIKFAYHELMTTSRDPKDWMSWIDQLKQSTMDDRDNKKIDYINRLESIISNIDPNNLNCIDAFMVAQLNDCAARMGINMMTNRNISI